MTDNPDPPIEELMISLIAQARVIAWRHWHSAPYVLEFDELVSLANKGLVEAHARWPLYCLTPDTPVLTANLRWVPVGSLEVGQELVGVDEYPVSKCGRYYRRAVVTETSRRSAPCVRISLDDGREVVCTPDHRWILRRQMGQYRAERLGVAGSTMSWFRADEIRVGDRMVSPLRVWLEDSSYEVGWLSGIYDGEGCVSRSTVSVAQKPGLVLDRMKEILSSMGLPCEPRYRPDDGCAKIDICTRRDALEVLGRLRPVRLLPKAPRLWEDRQIYNRGEACVAVVTAVEPVGIREVVTIETSTRTFLANGLISHNCEKNGFDPSTTRFFSVYCQRRMTGSILDYMRSLDWVSRTVRDRSRALRDAGQDQGQSQKQMAEATGMTEQEVSQTLAAMARRPVGFDPVEHDIQAAADTESNAVVDDLLETAVAVMQDLPLPVQFSLVLTFYNGLSVKQAAAVLGMEPGEVTALQQQGVLAVHQVLARAARER